MKILVAAERIGPAGGMERYLEVMLPALAARGAQVHVLARCVAGALPGITSERIAWSEEHDEPDAAAARAAKRALDAFAPDLALAENVMDAGVVEALRAARRLAYHVHDHRPFCPNGDRIYPRTGAVCRSPLGTACLVHALADGCAYGPRPRTLALVRRRERLRDAIARADVALVASRYVADRARSNGIAAARIVELPNPLSDDAYSEAVSAAPPDAPVVFAGRVVPQKGVISLVRALATIPSARRPPLHVFGDGPALPEVLREAVARGVTVEPHGAVPAAAVRAGFDRASLVVVPSLWAEPFGMVGIEAFARGRTVVAYATGGIASWLADGVNGTAVPPRDEAALGTAIDTLLRDVPRRDRLAAQARRDAERYRVGRIADLLLTALPVR